MKFVAIALAVTALVTLSSAAPARNTPSKASIAGDEQALEDLAGTDVDPNLENGTRLLSNGQGQCVAVSGKAVCSDESGATM